MPDEVLALLKPERGHVFVDATAGLGGHAALVASRLGPGGVVVLNDLDAGNLAKAAERVRLAGPARVEVIHGNFAGLPGALGRLGLTADMVLADLGFASSQVDDPARGLSFRVDGPLDMRLDPSGAETAATLVNSLPQSELARIIREYGEERHAAAVARKLVAARAAEPITTTRRLAELVRSVVPRSADSIDPATRTFQALRIAVNDELGSLDAFLLGLTRPVLPGGPRWLSPGARVAIISFHSLEDRRVKEAFAALAGAGACGKPGPLVRPSEGEIAANPRARSAKLRGVELSGA